MKSQSLTSRTVLSLNPIFAQAQYFRASIGSNLLTFRQTLATTTGKVATGLLVCSFGLGISLQANLLQNVYSSFAASQPPTITSQAVAATPPTAPDTTCLKPITSPTGEFATCASVLIDFAKLSSGDLATSPFLNIYTGAPEANQEAEYYTASPDNLRVESSALVLEARNKPTAGYRYTSARVDTKGKLDMLYGKLEVRALIPTGTGTWPAVWMLPSNPKYRDLSPDTNFQRYLNDGEIDIAEGVGTDPHNVYGIAHSLAYPADGPDRSYYNVTHVSDNDTVYHDYGMEWTPTRITFTVDNEPFFTMRKQPGVDYHSWPYDQQFYLIINLALGGSWGGNDRKNFPLDGVNPNALPASLKMQSIVYYPYTPPKAGSVN